MSKKKIVVVGSFMVDITGFAPRFPRDGESVFGSAIKFGPGGKGSNQATSASRSGGEVIMVTKLGRDVLSGIAHTHYSGEGMSEKYIYTTDEANTGSAFIEVNETTGENRIIVVPGSNGLITSDEVDAAEAEIASADATLTQLESSNEGTEELIRLAKKHGKPIILNPAPMRKVSDGFFEGVDYFTPNETEAEFFSGIKVTDKESAAAAAKKLIALGVKNVIITLGKNGAFWTDGHKSLSVPAVKVTAVDTTGAGDAFNGGFAVAISEGRDIEDAIKFASCVAAISVTRRGASASMPKREETNELYNKTFNKG